MKKYLKLNDNINHLSLGNVFNMIKKASINKDGAIQTEIFCILFNLENISDTTVNNYCTGYRAIGSSYKQIYINYRKHYQTDKTIMLKTINNLISVMEGTLYDTKDIKIINEFITLKTLCHNIHTLVKNDLYVKSYLKKDLLKYLEDNNYYEFIVNVLFFIILEKKQPLYPDELVTETIEEILDNTNMSVNDLKDYLTVEFKEGISLIPSLKKLALNNNPYALNQLGNLEYTGIIAGYKRPEEAYQYFLKAANSNHPTACWMIAHMLLNKEIGSLSNDDINLMWEYLKKAASLKSISAVNTLGLCYLFGYNPDNLKDENLALKYFKIAAKSNYVYAYNNLALYYEKKKDYKKALEYYEKSAHEENSWACNKMGLFYYQGKHLKKDVEKSYNYFLAGANAPISTRIEWNTYNLVNLFYLPGNSTLGIKKDLNKSLELLNTIANFKPANELFLYCYYELYLETKNKDYLDKINYYLNNLDTTINIKEKQKIEKKLKEIHDFKINIIL